MKDSWVNSGGEDCQLIARLIDGQRQLMAFKKRDMGGYHWSYHLEDVDVLQDLIERDKKQQIISPPLPPDPPKPRYGP